MTSPLEAFHRSNLLTYASLAAGIGAIPRPHGIGLAAFTCWPITLIVWSLLGRQCR